MVLLWRRLVIASRKGVLFSVIGQSVDPGDGFFSTLTMSCADAATKLFVVGIGTRMCLLGCHDSVSAMWMVSVSHIIVLKRCVKNTQRFTNTFAFTFKIKCVTFSAECKIYISSMMEFKTFSVYLKTPFLPWTSLLKTTFYLAYFQKCSTIKWFCKKNAKFGFQVNTKEK